MWELERKLNNSSAQVCLPPSRVAVVGGGRLGTMVARGLSAAGVQVTGPLGRGAAPTGIDAVLLCVPDSEIAAAAGIIPTGPLVGHCSGAATLEPLAPHDAFSLHPLMTVTPGDDPARLQGAGAAIAGSTAAALDAAGALARALGMRAVRIADRDRAAYHAAASIASNFLVTLEAAAERLLASTGAQRDLLVPLVRASVENWSRLGPDRALTGPVARGDDVTVARQRKAVADRAPDLLPLFNALVTATQALVHAGAAEAALA